LRSDTTNANQLKELAPTSSGCFYTRLLRSVEHAPTCMGLLIGSIYTAQPAAKPRSSLQCFALHSSLLSCSASQTRCSNCKNCHGAHHTSSIDVWRCPVAARTKHHQ
jgi:hypothetical protein